MKPNIPPEEGNRRLVPRRTPRRGPNVLWMRRPRRLVEPPSADMPVRRNADVGAVAVEYFFDASPPRGGSVVVVVV